VSLSWSNASKKICQCVLLKGSGYFISKEGLENPPVAQWRRERTRAGFDMKIINPVLIAGILLLVQPLKADTLEARSGNNARLIVNRSADFGVNESINLTIDGVQVAVLGINQNYDAALPAGKHVLSINTNPKIYGEDTPGQVSVNAAAGKTYTFTAVWNDSERASLEQQ
jgi:hypothetical protein